MPKKIRFHDFTTSVDVAELYSLRMDFLSKIERRKAEEKNLAAQLIASREERHQEEEYLDALTQYVDKLIRASVYPIERQKLVQKAHERFLKTFQVEEYKSLAKAKEIRELLEEAKKFAKLQGFNPNGIRASLMRNSLERMQAELRDLDPDVATVIQVDLNEALTSYAPRSPEEQKHVRENQQKIEIDLQSQIQKIVREVTEKVVGAVTKNDRQATTIDLEPETKS